MKPQDPMEVIGEAVTAHGLAYVLYSLIELTRQQHPDHHLNDWHWVISYLSQAADYAHTLANEAQA